MVLISCTLYPQTITRPLKDAATLADGLPKQTALDGGKEIIHKRMSMSEGASYCMTNRTKPGRLLVLLTVEAAEAFVTELFTKSEKLVDPVDGDDVVAQQTIGDAERKYDLGLSRRYWIGLTDLIKEGFWLWMNDGHELEYVEMWAGGQPDHLPGAVAQSKNEHCVTLWNPNFEALDDTKKVSGKHSFNDENCNMKHYFICEDIPDEQVARQGRSLSLVAEPVVGVNGNEDDVAHYPAIAEITGNNDGTVGNMSEQQQHDTMTQNRKRFSTVDKPMLGGNGSRRAVEKRPTSSFIEEMEDAPIPIANKVNANSSKPRLPLPRQAAGPDQNQKVQSFDKSLQPKEFEKEKEVKKNKRNMNNMGSILAQANKADPGIELIPISKLPSKVASPLDIDKLLKMQGPSKSEVVEGLHKKMTQTSAAKVNNDKHNLSSPPSQKMLAAASKIAKNVESPVEMGRASHSQSKIKLVAFGDSDNEPSSGNEYGREGDEMDAQQSWEQVSEEFQRRARDQMTTTTTTTTEAPYIPVRSYRPYGNRRRYTHRHSLYGNDNEDSSGKPSIMPEPEADAYNSPDKYADARQSSVLKYRKEAANRNEDVSERLSTKANKGNMLT